jgi:hypothetical protein
VRLEVQDFAKTTKVLEVIEATEATAIPDLDHVIHVPLAVTVVIETLLGCSTTQVFGLDHVFVARPLSLPLVCVQRGLYLWAKDPIATIRVWRIQAQFEHVLVFVPLRPEVKGRAPDKFLELLSIEPSRAAYALVAFKDPAGGCPRLRDKPL